LPHPWVGTVPWCRRGRPRPPSRDRGPHRPPHGPVLAGARRTADRAVPRPGRAGRRAARATHRHHRRPPVDARGPRHQAPEPV